MRTVLPKIVSFGIAGIFFAATAFAEPPSQPQSPAPTSNPRAATIPLYPGLGDVHHPVTTSSPLAQKYFDQGLAFAYGFNHDEAERSFDRAAQLDPHMAMAYWGSAWVLGPNYNSPGNIEASRKAYGALKSARALEGGATPEERDLIEALARRYGARGDNTAARGQAYADAMRAVAHRYPNDLDVQTIFAESLMDLHPWQLWDRDGKPGPNTIEIVTTLETVLKKDPNHLGANHYYIHAVEASRDPGRATASADRLAAMAPGAGHLVHMPSHIYIRTGRFHDSVLANENAINADETFLAASHETGMYPLMYLTHNIQFLCYSEMAEGSGRQALETARALEARVPLDAVRTMPMMEFLVPVPYFVEARFEMWDAILKEPAPPKDLLYTSAMWHYARGLAFTARGYKSEAERERADLAAIIAATPPTRPLGANGHARDVSELAAAILDGAMASAAGDHASAAARYDDAVRREDAIPYSEPPTWYFSVREALGAELLALERNRQAEDVFKKDLAANPGNPRSLYGLSQSLAAQGKAAEAARVNKRFKREWRYADSTPPPMRIAISRAN